MHESELVMNAFYSYSPTVLTVGSFDTNHSMHVSSLSI